MTAFLVQKSTPAVVKTTKPATPAVKVEATNSEGLPLVPILGGVSLLLALGIAGLGVYLKLQLEKRAKEVKFEQFKNQDLQKKLQLALETIKKMEANPDLVHSREFNLDYLRMRMDEEVFHYAIVNQVKIQIKQLISVALRPGSNEKTSVGIANTSGRQVDELFDITYETESQGKRTKRILFRIQIKLTKLPTQATSATINQIIDCIEKFLSPSDEEENWQPAIQGRVVVMQWDQKAKPTPLLVLEQLPEGGNVSFRTTPAGRGHTPETAPPHQSAKTAPRKPPVAPPAQGRATPEGRTPPPPPPRRNPTTPNPSSGGGSSPQGKPPRPRPSSPPTSNS